MRKLGRSKSESAESQTHRQPGLVGLLEILRAQLEVGCRIYLFTFVFSVVLYYIFVSLG